MEKETLWTKEFLIISLISFLSMLIFYLSIVCIAPYTTMEFHASTSTAGFASGIFVLGSLCGRLGAGRQIGIVGANKILWIGLIIFAVTTTFYIAAFSLELLIINRFVQGIGVGIVATGTGTIVAHLVPKSRKGEGIGYFSLSIILAMAIGPFVGIMLMNVKNGFDIIFILNTIIAVICIIIFAFVKLNLPLSKQESIENEPEQKPWIWKFIEKKSLPIAFMALLVGFGYSGIMSFISFYAVEIDLVTAASYFHLVYAIVAMLSRPITGKLFDIKGGNLIVYPCLIILAFGMFLFSQASAGWMLLVSAGFIGLGHGNFNSIAQTIAVKVTEPQSFGLATSTFFTLMNFGFGIGPYVLGFFVSTYGYRSIFVSSAILFVICIPIYHLLHGRKDKELLETGD